MREDVQNFDDFSKESWDDCLFPLKIDQYEQIFIIYIAFHFLFYFSTIFKDVFLTSFCNERASDYEYDIRFAIASC